MTTCSKRMTNWDLKLTMGQFFTVMLCLIFQTAPMQIWTRSMIFVKSACTVPICSVVRLHKYFRHGFVFFSRVVRCAPSMAEFHPILESKIILNRRYEPWVSIIQGNALRWRSVKHTCAVACPHSCFRHFLTQPTRPHSPRSSITCSVINIIVFKDHRKLSAGEPHISQPSVIHTACSKLWKNMSQFTL